MIRTNKIKKVISASRRLEMVGFFPEKLADFLTRRCPPDTVHTVVLWSKSPGPLIDNAALRSALRRYDQLFLHFTLTGMGATFLEPGIPSVETGLGYLDRLIDWIGGPERIRVRFDPIVHLKHPDDSTSSNLDQFMPIASAVRKAGIENIVVSWMASYPKVVRRLAQSGLSAVELNLEEWKGESDRLFAEARCIGVSLSGCCVQGLPVSKCIDGSLLSRLHPQKDPASVLKAKGQRLHCGCTESWDIGWYSPCPGGCLYCYARPVGK
ncbi:MAG TPA: DUF1848 family protein [bacterium]